MQMNERFDDLITAWQIDWVTEFFDWNVSDERTDRSCKEVNRKK
jgi:hypothetical protein